MKRYLVPSRRHVLAVVLAMSALVTGCRDNACFDPCKPVDPCKPANPCSVVPADPCKAVPAPCPPPAKPADCPGPGCPTPDCPTGNCIPVPHDAPIILPPAVAKPVVVVRPSRTGAAVIVSTPVTANGEPAQLAEHDLPVPAAYPDLSPGELNNYSVGKHVGIPPEDAASREE